MLLFKTLINEVQLYCREAEDNLFSAIFLPDTRISQDIGRVRTPNIECTITVFGQRQCVE